MTPTTPKEQAITLLADYATAQSAIKAATAEFEDKATQINAAIAKATAAEKARWSVKREIFQHLPLWLREGRSIRDEDCYSMAVREVLTASTLETFKAPGEARGDSYEGRFDGLSGRIEVSDMLYSLGAEHYYAEVTLPGFSWHSLSRPGICTIGGGLITPTRTVKMTMCLTDKEIRRAPSKYKAYRRGERYEGFNTPRDALIAAHRWVTSFTSGLSFTFDDGRDYDGLNELLNLYPARFA